MQQEINQKGKPKFDSIIILQLTAHQVKSIEVIGENNYDLENLSGEKKTLL